MVEFSDSGCGAFSGCGLGFGVLGVVAVARMEQFCLSLDQLFFPAKLGHRQHLEMLILAFPHFSDMFSS